MGNSSLSENVLSAKTLVHHPSSEAIPGQASRSVQIIRSGAGTSARQIRTASPGHASPLTSRPGSPFSPRLSSPPRTMTRTNSPPILGQLPSSGVSSSQTIEHAESNSVQSLYQQGSNARLAVDSNHSFSDSRTNSGIISPVDG